MFFPSGVTSGVTYYVLPSKYLYLSRLILYYLSLLFLYCSGWSQIWDHARIIFFFQPSRKDFRPFAIATIFGGGSEFRFLLNWQGAEVCKWFFPRTTCTKVACILPPIPPPPTQNSFTSVRQRTNISEMKLSIHVSIRFVLYDGTFSESTVGPVYLHYFFLAKIYLKCK